jgi:hypothetical protein
MVVGFRDALDAARQPYVNSSPGGLDFAVTLQHKTNVGGFMTSANPYRRFRLHSKSAHRLSGTAAAVAGLMLLAGPAHATVTTGESFLYDWTETKGPNVGLMGTVDFTLGPASTTMSGYFDLASFAVTSKGGFCGICSPLTENLSGAFFDASTLGVVGDITGTFTRTGMLGVVHTYMFDVVTMDFPAGTWTYTETNETTGGISAMDSGTYKTATTSSVDEPSTLFLLIPAGVALLISRRRRFGSSAL